MFGESMRELRRPRAVSLIGLLTALQIVVEMLTGIYIIPPTVKLSFSFIVLAATGLWFGPAAAALQGAAADVFVALLFPRGAYFPGFTFSAALSGAAYGLFFRGQGITWRRALCAKGLVNLLINTGLNTLWLSVLQGEAMAVLLPARLFKNAVLLPVEVLLLVLMEQALRRIPARLRGR